MARRNQPYLPLYVQDYLTDEKLNRCSAATQGVFIKIMCVLHKNETYGTILLKQKDKQNGSKISDFASYMVRQLPFSKDEIEGAMAELVDEGVLVISGDTMYQKRMVKDYLLSEKRAESGSKGGKKTTEKPKDFAQAKTQANSENESDNEIEVSKPLKESLNFSVVHHDYLPFMQIWVKYKTERKEYYKPSGFEALVKKVERECTPTQFEYLIEHAMSSNYAGLVWDKLNEIKNGKGISKNDQRTANYISVAHEVTREGE